MKNRKLRAAQRQADTEPAAAKRERIARKVTPARRQEIDRELDRHSSQSRFKQFFAADRAAGRIPTGSGAEAMAEIERQATDEEVQAAASKIVEDLAKEFTDQFNDKKVFGPPKPAAPQDGPIRYAHGFHAGPEGLQLCLVLHHEKEGAHPHRADLAIGGDMGSDLTNSVVLATFPHVGAGLQFRAALRAMLRDAETKGAVRALNSMVGTR